MKLGRLVAVIACASTLGAAACSRCGGEAPPPDASANEPLPAAPDRLIADIAIATPNGSWGKLQRGVGGAMGILPAQAGGIACAAFGIDPSFAEEIDGTAPGFAVLADDPADPSWALAFKLVEPRRAKNLVADDAGRFRPREADGFTELVPKSDAGAPTAALALTHAGYLVIARRSEDLPRLAGYVSRTLPSRPLPAGAIVVDVSRHALETVLAPKLESAWADVKSFLLAKDEAMRREHGGRPPDYGDPKAIVSVLDGIVRPRIETMKDLDRMRFALDVGDEDVVLHATLTPKPGGGPASSWVDAMALGDGSGVLAMPVESAIAMTTRDGEAARAAQGAAIEGAIDTSLGPRLGESDAKRVHGLVDDATKARGDTLGLALGWDEPRVTFLRGALRDQEAAERAVKAAVDLARATPFKEMLRVKDVTLGVQDIPSLGKVEVATIAREKTDGGAPRPRLPFDAGVPPVLRTPATGVAWRIEPSRIELAAAEDPAMGLAASARPAKKLGDDPGIVRALQPLGGDASTIVIAQPLRFDPRRANLPIAPVVIGVGRRDKDGFVRVDVSDGVLRELSRLAMGL